MLQRDEEKGSMDGQDNWLGLGLQPCCNCLGLLGKPGELRQDRVALERVQRACGSGYMGVRGAGQQR